MKRSRAITVGSASASLIAIGWAVGAGIGSPAQAIASGGTGTDTSTTGSSQVTTNTQQNSSGSGTTAADPTATASASPTPTQTTAAPKTSTFDGASVGTYYGNFQAEITVTDGKVTDITMLQEGLNDGQSRQINQYAVPILIKSVLKAQSANVSAVSGASYTSQGVLQSIDSALQQAGLA